MDASYWTARYQDDDTGWDVGNITTPLKAYFDQLEDKNLKILIPGAGNSYEAEYLFQHGFDEVHVLDISYLPLENLRKRVPAFPKEQLIQANFFKYEGQYDLIVEQTFFSAIYPEQREDYVQQMRKLLKPGGRLVGVLFTDVLLDRSEPPFGERHDKLRSYFEGHFKIKYFAPCYNSIPPREDSEWFIYVVKPAG